MNKLLKYFENPLRIIDFLGAHGFLKFLPDKVYLQLLYRSRMRKSLDFNNVRTFNEKIQWLKVYDRKNEYTMMVDKYSVKEYVSEKIGAQYIIPTLGVWDSFSAIDFDGLPNQFVLKCTHNSACCYICRDKNTINLKKVKKMLERSLKQNYYWPAREWPYKNVKPQIIAEQYIECADGDLPDYKIHCFNGEPKFILVCTKRYSEEGLKQDFFTVEWEHLNVKRPGHENSTELINKPEQLELMLELSKKLSEDITFLRTDFYIVNGQIYFGELTFYPSSGMTEFVPDRWDIEFGKLLAMPDNYKK